MLWRSEHLNIYSTLKYVQKVLVLEEIQPMQEADIPPSTDLDNPVSRGRFVLKDC